MMKNVVLMMIHKFPRLIVKQNCCGQCKSREITLISVITLILILFLENPIIMIGHAVMSKIMIVEDSNSNIKNFLQLFQIDF